MHTPSGGCLTVPESMGQSGVISGGVVGLRCRLLSCFPMVCCVTESSSRTREIRRESDRRTGTGKRGLDALCYPNDVEPELRRR
jgi:hypothetical protein